MAGVRIAVTGGYGFVGTAIISAIQSQLADVHVIILDKTTKPARPCATAGLQNIEVDITSFEDVKTAFENAKPDFVIHTAGYVPALDKRYTRDLEKAAQKVNVLGTRHVLDAAVACGCRGLIYTSSCCAVTDDLHGYFANIDEKWPVSTKSLIYGESKVTAENMVISANSKDFATCVLRPAVIFGEGDYQLVPSIHTCISKFETPFQLGQGNNLWDTVYVGNVAHAHALALKNLLSTKTAAGEIFFIQNNEPITFREFSLAIWKEFGHYPPFEVTIPQSLGYLAGFLAEWWTNVTGSPTTISRGSVLDACAMRYASGDKARQILEYEPIVGLEEGIKRSCQDYSRQLNSSSSSRMANGHLSNGHA